MRKFLFNTFSFFLIAFFGFFSYAANQVSSCVRDEDGCGAGCQESSGGLCEICGIGHYNSVSGGICKWCKLPGGGGYIESEENVGYTADVCPWEVYCEKNQYWDSFHTGCVSCDERYYTTNLSHRYSFYGEGPIINTSFNDPANYTFNKVCEPKVFTLTLDKNTKVSQINEVIYENKKAYVKYVKGFSDNEGGTWNRGNIPESVLQPSQAAKVFLGYYRSSDCNINTKYFDETGKLGGNIALGFFDNDMTLYACWDNPNITIYYYFEDPDETMKKQTCRVDDTKTEVDCNFEDYSGAGSAGKYFSGFSCMYKQENGVLAACSNDPDEIYEIGEPIPLLGTEIYVKIFFSDCPAGYYCEDSNLLVECPIGTTSDAVSSSIEDCYMPSGQSGAKFCDKNGCFYLPTGIGNISYNPS